MSIKGYVAISALIFVLVALVHIARLVQQWPLSLGPISVPMSVSWIGLVAAVALAIWGGTLLRR